MNDLGDAERIIDFMAVSWGKIPDYIAQRVDKWQRDGSTLSDIEAAFDYVERKRLEGPIDDPVALMHVRLRGTAPKPMQKIGGFLQAQTRPPEGIDTHDPDAVPPRMVWVRTDAPCEACKFQRLGARASQLAGVAHTCGEMRPYVEVNRPFIEARHEEAKRENECRLCWGAGFRWSYEATPENRLETGGQRTIFHDRRGVRELVVCPRQRGRHA